MTGLNFYDTYITSWLKILATLDGFLTKAEAHAKETGKDADKDYIGARIIDDMLPLTFQIQTVTNMMKMPIKILTDRPAEEWANEEKTFAELHARIAKAVELLKSVKPEEMNGREEELVKVGGPIAGTYPNGIRAKDVFGSISQPGLFFHTITAYNILRKEGVPLGKMDYLGPILPKPE